MNDRADRSNEGQDEFSFRYPFYVLSRHKKKVVVCFAALLALVALATVSQKSTYRSEAKLLVQVGRESVGLDPTANTGQTVDLRRDRDQELRAELAILRSPDLARLVVESVGASRILEPGSAPAGPDDEARATLLAGALDAARDVRKFLIGLVPGETRIELSDEDQAFFVVSDGLDIDLVDESSVLDLRYTGSDPQLAQHVLGNLIERFQERHLEVHRTPGSYEFFAQQSEHFASELRQGEEELKSLKEKAGFASVSALRSALLDRLASLRRDLDETEAGIGSASAAASVLRDILAKLPEVVVISERVADSSPSTEYIQQRLSELTLEEKGLAQNYNDTSERLKGVREQIGAASELLAQANAETSEVTRGPNATRLEMELKLLQDEARLESLSGRRAILTAQETRFLGELETLNASELEIAQLQRKVDGLEQNYLRYAESFEQARVGQALELGKISNIRVIQPATLPLESSGRGRGFTLALGALMSLLGALSLAFVSERFDTSIKSPADVQRRLGLTTVASISDRHLYRWKTATDALASRRNSSPAEFLELGDLILARGSSSDPRGTVLGLTSARRGEGVSTVSTHLAAALAQHADGPVLIVDAELERPRVHREFEVDATPGLSELVDESVAMNGQEAKIPNLRVLSAGRGGTPQKLLKNGRFEVLLNLWRREYAYVVVDLPALSEPSSATRLAALCDSVLLVTAAEAHPWTVVDHGRELLERCQANVIGAVLNKQRYPRRG